MSLELKKADSKRSKYTVTVYSDDKAYTRREIRA